MKCPRCGTENDDRNMICKNCKTNFAQNINYENDRSGNNSVQTKTVHRTVNSKKTIIISCLLGVLIFVIGKNVYHQRKINNFVNELGIEIAREIPNTVTYEISSPSNRYRDLILTFPNDFDTKTPEERASILGEIMQKYKKSRSNLMYKYDLEFKDITVLPFITARTQTKTYTYNDIDRFKDADGKEINLYDKYHDNSSASTTSTSSDVYTTSEPSDLEKGFAWGAAIIAVKENLKAPSTAKFPFSYSSADIKKIDINTFVVKSYVDAENSFGAKIRNNFTVTIIKNSETSFNYKDIYITSE
jgi:hypothetical protein